MWCGFWCGFWHRFSALILKQIFKSQPNGACCGFSASCLLQGRFSVESTLSLLFFSVAWISSGFWCVIGGRFCEESASNSSSKSVMWTYPKGVFHPLNSALKYSYINQLLRIVPAAVHLCATTTGNTKGDNVYVVNVFEGDQLIGSPPPG